MEPIQIISYIFSIITIASCFTIKVPQIRTIMRRKSSEGISIPGLMMEIMGFTITALYNYANSYSLWTYLEYPVILVQLHFMLYIVLKYKNLLKEPFVQFLGLYVAIIFGFATELIPYKVLTTIFPLCTPLSCIAKITYVSEIYKLGNSYSVSLTTWVISISTNLMRCFTVYVDSADIIIMTNLMLSSVMSGAVLLTAMYYRRFPREVDQHHTTRRHSHAHSD